MGILKDLKKDKERKEFKEATLSQKKLADTNRAGTENIVAQLRAVNITKNYDPAYISKNNAIKTHFIELFSHNIPANGETDFQEVINYTLKHIYYIHNAFKGGNVNGINYGWKALESDFESLQPLPMENREEAFALRKKKAVLYKGILESCENAFVCKGNSIIAHRRAEEKYNKTNEYKNELQALKENGTYNELVEDELNSPNLNVNSLSKAARDCYMAEKKFVDSARSLDTEMNREAIFEHNFNIWWQQVDTIFSEINAEIPIQSADVKQALENLKEDVVKRLSTTIDLQKEVSDATKAIADIYDNYWTDPNMVLDIMETHDVAEKIMRDMEIQNEAAAAQRLKNEQENAQKNENNRTVLTN